MGEERRKTRLRLTQLASPGLLGRKNAKKNRPSSAPPTIAEGGNNQQVEPRGRPSRQSVAVISSSALLAGSKFLGRFISIVKISRCRSDTTDNFYKLSADLCVLDCVKLCKEQREECLSLCCEKNAHLSGVRYRRSCPLSEAAVAASFLFSLDEPQKVGPPCALCFGFVDSWKKLAFSN